MSRPRVAEASPTHGRPAGQSTQLTTAVHRRVAVQGSGGVSATIVVIARQGHVWLSITPPFTWEAILEPIAVDELTHTLELARLDATKMSADPEKRTFPATIRKITG